MKRLIKTKKLNALKNNKNNIFTYLWLLAIILLSLFILYKQNDLNACFGLVDGVINLTLSVILLVLLIAFIVVQFLAGIRKKENLPFRFLICFLGIVLVGFTLLEYENRKENKLQNGILIASTNEEDNDVAKIILFDNNLYYALYGNVDWACSFTGKYEIREDTLFLENKPFEISNNRISNQYILTEITLIPVLEQKDIILKELNIEKQLLPFNKVK